MSSLRRATPVDMATCASIHRAAFDAALPWLAGLHTPEEDLAYFSGPVFDACHVWLTGEPTRGFIAWREGWIDQLYVEPAAQGQGLGPALLAKALEDGSERRLWTFQRNARARAFYERHGFTAERFTDGSGNEESEPDVLYRRPPASAA